MNGQAALLIVFAVGGSAACVVIFLFLKLVKDSVNDRLRLSDVIGNLNEGFYTTTLDGVLISSNPAMVAICGDKSEQDLIARVSGNAGEWYVDQSRREEYKTLLAKYGKIEKLISEVRVGDDKRRIWISENARLVHSLTTGKPLYYEGTVVDITDTVKRFEEQQRLDKLASYVPGGLFQLKRTQAGRYEVIYSSSGFRDLLDFPHSIPQFDVNHFVTLIHPDDLPGYYAALQLSRRNMVQWSHDFRVVTDGGKSKWLKVQATPESTGEGIVLWHGYLQDITASKADEALIRLLAFTDTLTRLPNRRFLVDRLQQTIVKCGHSGTHAAVLFIDIDHFKALNDALGHDAGDMLLVQIAQRLQKVAGKGNIVARLAGDEFVVLLNDIGDNEVMARHCVGGVAEKILGAFSTVFNLGKHEHQATCSIGAITFDGNSISVDDILKFADSSMYEVKRSGRNAFKIFEQSQLLNSEDQSLLADDLKHAIERGQLSLRYQPQIDRSGAIIGAEALVRWNHPKLGLLAPDRFMQMAEEIGQIREIGQWVIENSVKTLSIWQGKQSLSTMRLAANVSPQQFLDKSFVQEIRRLVKLYHISPGYLTLELTERLIERNRLNCLRVMEGLKSTGVRLSLDDFGTGFSSLAHLNEMPLDEIKIDGKFVTDMQNRSKDAALVKSILALAEALGLDTVAEHVETQAQEEFLQTNGCDIFQGYLYNGAMTLSDFEDAVVRNAIGTGYQADIAKVA